jgi:glycosyltransferase involved in cell wall biosynthesis
LTAYTVLSYLLDRGHKVHVVAVHDVPYYDPGGATLEGRIDFLRRLGADVSEIPSRAAESVNTAPRNLRARVRRASRPFEYELYPHLLDADAVSAAVNEIAPDVAFVYHFEAIAASRSSLVPRFAAVGDPSHLPAYYRWRADWPRPRAFRAALRIQAFARHQPRLMAQLLRECDASGAFAAHHAEWLRRMGVASCVYLRTPVPDAVGDTWRAERGRYEDNHRPSILLLGHLRGIATIDGLRVFTRMLPSLERELGADGFTVDVVGGYDFPPELAERFSRPAVHRHGHVEEPDEWLKRADVLLVPTAIPLGVRVRIITGFSFGSCVVTHRANSLGIPELEHGKNVLLGETPEALAGAVIRAVRDPELRHRLQAGARATYERSFAPPVAAGRIVDILERIASRSRTR